MTDLTIKEITQEVYSGSTNVLLVYVHLGRGDFITFLNKKNYKTDSREEEELLEMTHLTFLRW